MPLSSEEEQAGQSVGGKHEGPIADTQSPETVGRRGASAHSGMPRRAQKGYVSFPLPPPG